MKLKILTVLILATCVCGGAIAWSYFDVSRPDAIPLDTSDASPGRLFAYNLTLPFSDDNAVALEIRRVSSPNNQDYTVGSVSGNLRVSSEDAEMTVSTGLISSRKKPDEILVSVCLLEVDDILVDTSGFGEWVIAGRLKIPGVSTKLMPKEKFCLGGSLSTGWERNPSWQDNEICVGRFRSHDENRIYDYYCVVVASNQKMR
ncbi:hypothetical protein NZK35_33085 [Stieleria sp. ICT_E10.1]|uniref:hypothetical protein n=1 Tax=Stieleria sedimenti TaxID=2976331 RepID=UPI0021802034|nr:hypothetical protein [Stieleria sedimenti]MCS7471509.1 hypothetical protein [Stieleria sedimenti]